MNVLDGYMDAIRRSGDDAARLFNAQIERICQRLDTIADGVDALDARRERFRLPVNGEADSTGLALLDIPLDRIGYAFTIDYLVTVVAGGSASIGVAYLGSVNAENVFAVVDDADMFVSDLMDVHVPDYIPGIVVRITGAPVNAQCTAVIQGTRHLGRE